MKIIVNVDIDELIIDICVSPCLFFFQCQPMEPMEPYKATIRPVLADCGDFALPLHLCRAILFPLPELSCHALIYSPSGPARLVLGLYLANDSPLVPLPDRLKLRNHCYRETTGSRSGSNFHRPLWSSLRRDQVKPEPCSCVVPILRNVQPYAIDVVSSSCGNGAG